MTADQPGGLPENDLPAAEYKQTPLPASAHPTIGLRIDLQPGVEWSRDIAHTVRTAITALDQMKHFGIRMNPNAPEGFLRRHSTTAVAPEEMEALLKDALIRCREVCIDLPDTVTDIGTVRLDNSVVPDASWQSKTQKEQCVGSDSAPAVVTDEELAEASTAA